MKKLFTLIATMLFALAMNAQYYVHYANTDFDDETYTWQTYAGFDWGGDGSYSTFDNANKTVNLLIDSYDASIGEVAVNLLLLKSSGNWAEMENVSIRVLTASDFDADGRATVTFDIPDGTIPAEDHADYETGTNDAGEPIEDAWFLQVVAADVTPSYVNFKIFIAETIGGTPILSTEAPEAKVFPNPVAAGTAFEVEGTEASVEVYSLGGQLVSTSTTIEEAGIYTVKVTSAEGVSFAKVVVE